MTPLRHNRSSPILPACSLAVAAAFSVALGAGDVEVGVQGGILVGVSTALLCVFGLVWSLGIRYADVGWMVVLLAMAVIEALCGLHESAPYVALAPTMRFALILSLGGFLVTFYRRRFRRGRLEVVFILLTAAFAGARAWLPTEYRNAARMDVDLASYLGAVVLSYAAFYGFLSLKPLPPMRRRYVQMVAVTAAFSAALYLLDGKFGRLHGASSGRSLAAMRLDHAVIVAFALFVAVDLVIFHRHHYRDKARRVSGRESVPTATDAAVARAQAAEAMPREQRGRFGGFAYEFHFEFGRTPAGDWIFAWDKGAERRFLTGEVRGLDTDLGPAVAQVMVALHESRAQGLALPKAATLLHERLVDLFAGEVTTSLMAISTALDGTIELYNCGGPGFFVVSRDGCRHYPLGSSRLGADGGFEPAICPIPLDDGDLLFCGNDGLFGDDSIEGVLAHFEEDMDFRLDAGYVHGAVLSARRPDGEKPNGTTGQEPEDQTLFLLQKHAS